MTESGSLLAVGAMLPAATLPARDPSGRDLRLRWQPNGTLVLVLPHPGGCSGCDRYLRDLAAHAGEYRVWDSRPVAVLPADAPAPPQLPFPVVTDPDGRLRAGCGLGDGAAVLIADRFGQVHRSAAGGAGEHPFPEAASELLDEVRHLGIQCPECDQPDFAGLGRWAPEGARP